MLRALDRVIDRITTLLLGPAATAGVCSPPGEDIRRMIGPGSGSWPAPVVAGAPVRAVGPVGPAVLVSH